MNANEAKVAERTERAPEQRPERKAWCAEAGIKAARYYRWEREVLRKASANQEKAERKPTFVELPEAGMGKRKTCGKGRVVAKLETGQGAHKAVSGRSVPGASGMSV
ncbi:MAG: hypothetical protein IJQ81_05055 [Oscillibacter sp.]|nr:hypothetical protein [Oscillibacter sp.]